MKLLIKIKNVYGRETVYPVCEKSKLLCEMAGQSTLTPNTLKIAKQLGYEFEVQAQEFFIK